MEKILSALNSLAETWLTFGSASYPIDLNDTLLGGLGLLLLYVCYLIVKLVLQPLWRKKYTQKLPELYASAENFNNESKKSNFQKLCATSFEEARQLLGKNLGTVPFAASGAERKDEPHPAVQSPVSNEEQKLTSMADLLHHSLLMGSLVPLEQLSRTQHRLIQAGIPPPVHTFPYGFRTDEPIVTPTPPFRKRLPSHTFQKLLLASVTPDRLVFEDKSMRFFSLEPGLSAPALAQGGEQAEEGGAAGLGPGLPLGRKCPPARGASEENALTRFLASSLPGDRTRHPAAPQILSPGFKMMGLGNGRRSMKSPPLIMAALVACVIVLGFNYWLASSRSMELQTRIVELEGRVRRAAAERGAVELKKNEFQGELQKQREQLDRIQSSHSFQMENVHRLHQDEKARPLSPPPSSE
ncbi:Golgi membrane protein 1 [Microtus ochrogaster]|uniref:Golgi membrane protein 1 n=1 Tax=Microtus ochrogaster TaxID=79684 RepID=A0A8J6KM47_MICOH|nr:Golgi membrane protein 1 [Microtus ochrogaster]